MNLEFRRRERGERDGEKEVRMGQLCEMKNVTIVYIRTYV